MLNILENILSNDFPIDLIKLITTFVCNCENYLCNFCNEQLPNCYLKWCANCKKKSCGDKSCPKFKVDFIMCYSYLHKEIKCCHKCPDCIN